MIKLFDYDGFVCLWNRIKDYIDSSGVIYEAKSLTYDGTNCTEIDFQPFSAGTDDFTLTALIHFNPSDNSSSSTILSCFNEVYGSYDGVLVRAYDTYIWTVVGDNGGLITVDSDDNDSCLIEWIKVGDTSCVRFTCGSSTSAYTCKHTVAFDNNLMLGAALDENGDVFRYAVGTVDYIKIVRI